MPELPEVETIARGVDERLRGDRIETTWFSEKPEPFKSSPQLMAKELPGRRIDRVHRVGKHIVFDLADRPGVPGLQWIVHLGMTGRLLVADPATPVPPHTHGILHLASGRELRFVDPRRFGRMALHGAPDRKTTPFTGHRSGAPQHFARTSSPRCFRPRRTSIKAALLNQKLLHGVGNIYADESLFRAGIRPRRMARHLKRAELDRLHASLQTVLREADLAGWLIRFRLCRCGRRGRLLPTRASGLSPHRPAMPGVRNTDPAHRRGWPGNALLPPLPALGFL